VSQELYPSPALPYFAGEGEKLAISYIEADISSSLCLQGEVGRG
jgi:hypothetical protein